MNKRKDLPMSYLYALLAAVFLPFVALSILLRGFGGVLVEFYHDNKNLLSEMYNAPREFREQEFTRRAIRARRRNAAAKTETIQ
jgi:hypothetical protein